MIPLGIYAGAAAKDNVGKGVILWESMFAKSVVALILQFANG